MIEQTSNRKFVVRGIILANLDAMCKAACQAAPWREDGWKALQHDLEEVLAAKWRKEDDHITADTTEKED
jgi:hypothetical protein